MDAVRAGLVCACVAWVAGLGCTRPNPSYCERDDDCGDGKVCDLGTNLCVSQADGGVDAHLPDASGDGPRPDAPPSCGVSSDCVDDPAKPICELGECRPCADGAECLAHSQETPVCEAGSCRACAQDAECAEARPDVGVCAAGVCPAADEVLWVDAAAACTGKGTPVEPYCDVQHALDAAKGTPGQVIVVRPGSYAGFVAKDLEAAVVGLPGGEVTVSAGTAAAAADVDGGHLTLRRLHLSGGSAAALRCASATCVGEELKVEGSTGGGVVANLGRLELSRSQVYSNMGGGIVTQGSEFLIVNNFIHSNGGIVQDVGGALFVQNLGTTDHFVNNTVFFNLSQNPGAGVQCVNGSPTVANNIIWNNGDGTVPAAALEACHASYSVTDDPVLQQVSGAHNIGDAPVFVRETYPPDLHVQAGSGGLGLGDSSVAPPDDIDGDPRPESAIDIGADQISVAP